MPSAPTVTTIGAGATFEPEVGWGGAWSGSVAGAVDWVGSCCTAPLSAAPWSVVPL
jgi:hypothetical protein